jgi:hypothetical protein
MKHYQTRIAFAEKEIEKLAHGMSWDFDTVPLELVGIDFYIDKLNQANRIRKYYISKNYEYKRARMKNNLHK